MGFPENCSTTVPLDAHEAILRRGYHWVPCFCDHGIILIGWGLPARCGECYGDGGRYMVEPTTNHPRSDVPQAAGNDGGVSANSHTTHAQ